MATQDKNRTEHISDEDGPFSYTYLAIMSVPGIRLDDTQHTLPLFSFQNLNAEAFLTSEWDKYCKHMDRSNAISTLMLTGFRGQSRFGKISVYWHKILLKTLGPRKIFHRSLNKEEIIIREIRHKEQKSPGCYLVYRAEGQTLSSPQLNTTIKYGSIGYGLDVVDGKNYRTFHKSAVHSAATALSLTIAEKDGSPDIHWIGDIVYLNGNKGLTIYPKRFEAGGVSISMSTAPTSNDLQKANDFVPLKVSDSRIEAAISLFVHSHRRDGDNMRAFVFAWSALELLVDRLAQDVRADWKELLKNGDVPEWAMHLSDTQPGKYRMKGRFISVACTLDIDAAKEDSDLFSQAYDARNGFYHRQAVEENDLPTHDVKILFRKYLALSLHYKMRTNSHK